MMKKLFVIGVAIFWSLVIALMSASVYLSFFNQPKTENNLTGQTENLSEMDNSIATEATFFERISDALETAEAEMFDDSYVPNSDPKYKTSDRIMVTQTIRVRKEATTDAETVGTLNTGTLGTISSEAISNSGYWWYQINYANGLIGWSVEDFITLYDSSKSASANYNLTETTATPTPAPETNTESSISASTVAKHNSASDCWVIIEQNVYDVTAYIPFHPGGEEKITSACGTDATLLFTGATPEGHKHRTSAYNILDKYYIGPLS